MTTTVNTHEVITACRACGADDRVEVLSLGDMPLADGLRAPDAAEPERRFPLTVDFCRACSLVQIQENVPADLLFGEDYPYYSSFSDAWVEHCRENALELIDTRSLGANSLVTELACNDGYFLRHFAEHGVPVLGIDPAPGPAAAARAAGLDVREEFFTDALAAELPRADVVLGNNVLAHVPDLSGFVAGIARMLKDDGVAMIEVPYMRDLVEKCAFDTIYHEHHCYFSVSALDRLFAAAGLFLNEVRRLPTHGGSLRLYAEKRQGPRPTVDRLLDEERELGMDRAAYYEGFGERVRDLCRDLVALLSRLKGEGARIVAYGAAAKGAMLLNAAGVGPDLLEFVVDRNVHKHGLLMPGVELLVRDTVVLAEEQPDYVLLLAWNHAPEIIAQQTEYHGRYVVPVPRPEVLA